MRRLEEASLLDLVRGYDDKVDLDVVMLQQKLQLVVGKDCVAVDGVYGPRTTRAVQRFMREKGLHGGGGLTDQAHALLREAFLSELETRALQRAPSGDACPDDAASTDQVRILQLSLNQVLGRQFVKPDGVYGPKTRAAIEQFQADFGLPLGGDVAEQLKVVNMTLRAAAAEAKRDAAASLGLAAAAEESPDSGARA